MGKVVKKIAPIALPILGGLAGGPLGIGAIAGGALGGAAGGAIGGGGLKSALLGAGLGGLGGATIGNISGLGSKLLGTTGGAFGPATAAQVASAGGTNAALTNLAAGSGLKGILSGGGGLSNLSTLARVGTSLYGGSQDDKALKDAQRAMLTAQGRATEQLQPYGQIGLQAQQQLSNNLSSGFDPGDLTQDRGYQFRLNEGMDKLNASLAAQGLGQSGGAMKALEDYRQQFAANEYQNAYDRWLSQNNQLAGVGNQGRVTAGDLSTLAQETGLVNAGTIKEQNDARNKRIAEILAGLGMGNA